MVKLVNSVLLMPLLLHSPISIIIKCSIKISLYRGLHLITFYVYFVYSAFWNMDVIFTSTYESIYTLKHLCTNYDITSNNFVNLWAYQKGCRHFYVSMLENENKYQRICKGINTYLHTHTHTNILNKIITKQLFQRIRK